MVAVESQDMDGDILSRVESSLKPHPELWAGEVSASDVEKLQEFSGFRLPECYRSFVMRFGGAIVGPYPVYGLRGADAMGTDESSAIAVTKRFRDQHWPGSEQWLVVSIDHAGNPIGLDREGRIWISDHDAGVVEIVCADFNEYLRVRCLGLPK